MDYDKDLLNDVVSFLEEIEDEIKTALIDGAEFGDIDDGEIRCRMEESIYTPFSLEDAAFVINNCENEETDAGLCEGLDQTDAIIAMAVYSYSADAWDKAEELYDEMFTEYVDEDDGLRFDKMDMANIVWDEFLKRHTIEPVDAGGITELTILEHWIRLNNNAGMWNRSPFGGAYIDARCGVGYSMPDIKNFVDCDRTAQYQLPHMNGKCRDDVKARIDELKETMMTGIEKHHAKLDELIDGAREEMHRMMNNAVLSGAVSNDMLPYRLARAIVTMYGDERQHATLTTIANTEIDNLAKML